MRTATPTRLAHLTSIKCPRVGPSSLPSASTALSASTSALPAEMPFCKRRPISDYEYSTCILACIPPPPLPTLINPPIPSERRLHLSSSSRNSRRRRRRRCIKSSKSPTTATATVCNEVRSRCPKKAREYEALRDGSIATDCLFYARKHASVCPTFKLSNPSREADQ